MNTPELLVNEHCALAENPCWHPDRQQFFWTDINAGKIFYYDPSSRSHELVYDQSIPVGGFTVQADGNLLLFRVNDIAVLDLDSREVRPVLTYSDDGMERFNDVIADPEGRVFAGTIGKTETSGGLYRVDLDGTVTQLFTGTGCANGMAFAADLEQFYWTCSTTKKIFRFSYDRATGELSDRDLFYDVPEDEQTPDGLTIDTEGDIWSARWDGWGVMRISPQGAKLEKFEFPVAKITSVCFGGKDFGTLYATTAGGDREKSTDDGAIYVITDMPVTGTADFRSRIKL